MQRPPIEEVLDAHRDTLMALPGVQGVAVGERDDEPCIRMLVAGTPPADTPATLDGYAVVVERQGPFRPVGRGGGGSGHRGSARG